MYTNAYRKLIIISIITMPLFSCSGVINHTDGHDVLWPLRRLGRPRVIPDRKFVIMVALPSTHSIVAIFGVKGTHQTSDDFPVAGHSIQMRP